MSAVVLLGLPELAEPRGLDTLAAHAWSVFSRAFLRVHCDQISSSKCLANAFWLCGRQVSRGTFRFLAFHAEFSGSLRFVCLKWGRFCMLRLEVLDLGSPALAAGPGPTGANMPRKIPVDGCDIHKPHHLETMVETTVGGHFFTRESSDTTVSGWCCGLWISQPSAASAPRLGQRNREKHRQGKGKGLRGFEQKVKVWIGGLPADNCSIELPLGQSGAPPLPM